VDLIQKNFFQLKKIKRDLFLNLNKREKIILQLGRMVPRKGVDNVIRAIGRLKDAELRLKLIIVGGESDLPDPVLCPEIKRLQQIAIDEKVQNEVVFTGRKGRNVLRYYYAAANLFISTPWYEPFGITPLEAMACGTPVIGSNVGGIKYSVVDGYTGFLVPPHDPEALAGKIIDLLSNEELYSLMQKNAVRRVNKFFTWSKVAQEVHKLYEKVLSGSRKKVLGQDLVLPLENFALRSIEHLLNESSVYTKLKVQQ